MAVKTFDPSTAVPVEASTTTGFDPNTAVPVENTSQSRVTGFDPATAQEVPSWNPATGNTIQQRIQQEIQGQNFTPALGTAVIQTLKNPVQTALTGQVLAPEYKGPSLTEAYKAFREGKITEDEWNGIQAKVDQPLQEADPLMFFAQGKILSKLPGLVQLASLVGLPAIAVGTAKTPEEKANALVGQAFNVGSSVATAKAGSLLRNNGGSVGAKITAIRDQTLQEKILGNTGEKIEVEVNARDPKVAQSLRENSDMGFVTGAQEKLMNALAAKGDKDLEKVKLTLSQGDITHPDVLGEALDHAAPILRKVDSKEQLGMILGDDRAAEVIWNTPENQLAQQLKLPNKAKSMFLVKEPEGRIDTGIKRIISNLNDIKGKGNLASAKLQTMTTLMDAGDENGLFNQAFADPLIDVEARRGLVFDNLQKTRTSIDQLRGMDYDAPVKGDPNGFNQRQRIAAYLQLKNKVSQQRALNRGVRKDGDLANPYYVTADDSGNIQVNEFLTPTEKQQALVMERSFQAWTPDRTKALSELTGEEVKPLENYYPIDYVKDTGVMNSGEERLMGKILTSYEKNKQQVDTSSAKGRAKELSGRLYFDAYKTYDNWITGTSKLIAAAPVAREMQRKLKAIMPTMQEKYGTKVAENFREAVTDALTQGMQGNVPILTKLKNLSYETILTGNPIKTASIQPAALFNAADEVGWANVWRGTKLLNTPEGKAILAKDPIIKLRYMDPVREETLISDAISRDTKSTKLDRALMKTKNVLLSPISKMDAVVANAAYLAAYLKHMDINPGDELGAIKAARRTLANTQSMSQTVYRPAIQRGSGGRAEIGKALTMFNTQQFSSWNAMLKHTIRLKNGLETPGEYVMHGVNNMLLPAMWTAMVDVGAGVLGGEALDGAEVAASLPLNMIQTIPAVGSWVSSIVYNNGKLYFPFQRPIEVGVKPGIEMFNDPNVLDVATSSFDTYMSLKHHIGTRAFKHKDKIAELLGG